ncbi:MAG: hypothetical protein KA954_14325 [Chitinophagales bacterium]|nr:hypothetical protein [Chitinophagales bacterium]MBP8892695.1 hypothetical protein [Saprospiraceae bacterium]
MRLVIILLILSSFAACSILNQPRDYTYAKDPFSLYDYNQLQNNTIDTNSYYYNVSWLIVGSDGKTSVSIVEDSVYHILLFLINGQLRWLNLDHKPSYSEAMTSAYAEYHYYKIEDGILKLEIYADGMNGFDYWKGKIYEDSLVFFRINNVKQHLVYLKVKE